jgi:hypothetical protein
MRQRGRGGRCGPRSLGASPRGATITRRSVVTRAAARSPGQPDRGPGAGSAPGRPDAPGRLRGRRRFGYRRPPRTRHPARSLRSATRPPPAGRARLRRGQDRAWSLWFSRPRNANSRRNRSRTPPRARIRLASPAPVQRVGAQAQKTSPGKVFVASMQGRQRGHELEDAPGARVEGQWLGQLGDSGSDGHQADPAGAYIRVVSR